MLGLPNVVLPETWSRQHPAACRALRGQFSTAHAQSQYAFKPKIFHDCHVKRIIVVYGQIFSKQLEMGR